MSDPIASWLSDDAPDQPSSPACLRMPAEWEPMEAVCLSWPVDPALWGEARERAISEFVALLAVLQRYARINLICTESAQESMLECLQNGGVDINALDLFAIRTDDVWCRDHGPTFVLDEKARQMHAVNWIYNGWGEKFPHEWDAKAAQSMALAMLCPRQDSELVCEGGALEINSQGVLLTTESVLTHPKRNPDWSHRDIEAELKEKLGAKEVVWLRAGLDGDDTDGHIDMLTRFYSDEGIVTVRRKQSSAPDYRVLEENYERLKALRTPTGGHYDIACLPLPEPRTLSNWRYSQVPLSYANFLILNAGLIVPAYGNEKEDAYARGLLAELFPKHEIVGTPTRELIREGGAVHCLTQQVPAL